MAKKKESGSPEGQAGSKPVEAGATPAPGASPKTDKPRRSNAKRIRDAAILKRSLEGAYTYEIAKEFNLSRQTVSEILNSPSAKAKADKINEQLDSMIPMALKTVFDSIKSGDALLARDLLRSKGALQDLKKIEVTGKDGGPLKVKAEVKSELKISLEERIKILKGET